MNADSIQAAAGDLPPAIVIHGLEHARLALGAAGSAPVTLLSAPDAACFMGAPWWRALVALVSREHPKHVIIELLDCGDAAGRALQALRLGQRRLVLASSCPQRVAVLERAGPLAAVVLEDRPTALDLADPGAPRRLQQWVGRPGFRPIP